MVHALIAALLAIPSINAADTLPKGYLWLAQAKVPTVELDPQNKLKVEKKFDASGLLTELTYYDYSSEPAQVERLEISRNQKPFAEIRTRTTLKGKVVLRREIERYAKTDVLDEREVLWSSKRDGKLDRRTIMRYDEVEIDVQEFDLVGESWKLRSTSRHPAAETSRLDNYLACVKGTHNLADEAACRTYLETLPLNELKLQETGLPSFAAIECSKDDLYYLPNGFTVDLVSCRRKPPNDNAVPRLRDATNQVMSSMVSCLRELNPKLAARFSLNIAARRPRLRCAYDQAYFPVKNYCDEKSSKFDECSKGFTKKRDVAGGFYSSRFPNDLFLTGGDPAAKDPSTSSLASLIFHEGLHSAGLSGKELNNPHHDHTPPHPGDAVYGCESLCGMKSSRARLTREGCEACVSSTENVPSLKLLNDCRRFPKADTLIEAQAASDAAADSVRCLQGNAQLCTALTYNTFYKSVCASIADKKACFQKIGPEAVKALLKIAKSAEGPETLRNVDFEVSSGRIKDTAFATGVRARFEVAIEAGLCVELSQKPKLTEQDLFEVRQRFNGTPEGLLPDVFKQSVVSVEKFCRKKAGTTK